MKRDHTDGSIGSHEDVEETETDQLSHVLVEK